MIRKTIRNTAVFAAGIAMILSLNGMDIQAAEAYRDTAVAGIDAAIDEYILNAPQEPSVPEGTEATEAEPSEALVQADRKSVV